MNSTDISSSDFDVLLLLKMHYHFVKLWNNTDVFAYRSFYKEEKKNVPELTEEELEKVGNTP